MTTNHIAVSSIAERQAPSLMRTASLVHNLQLCTLYSTTREASKIRLKGSTTIASGLNLLANEGLEALVDVNASLNDIRYTAHSIAEPNGTLSMLVNSFGKPEGTRTFDRKLRILQEEVDQCSASCKRVNDVLQAWKNDINKFKEMTGTAKSTEETAAGEAEEDIEFQISNITDAMKELEHFKREEKNAQEKHKSAIDKLEPLNVSQHIPSTWDVPSMLFSSVSIGWAYFKSTVADKTLQQTQKEVDRRRADATDYERQLDQARKSLTAAQQKSQRLDDYLAALGKTLRALEYITNDVRAVAVEFNEMKTAMKKVTEATERGIGRTVDDTMVDGPSQEDTTDFVMNAAKMQTLALVIEHLAWLYADIIKNVLMVGFQPLHSGSGCDHEGDDLTGLVPIDNASSSSLTLTENTEIVRISNKIDSLYKDSYMRLQRTMIAATKSSVNRGSTTSTTTTTTTTSTADSNVPPRKKKMGRLFKKKS